jgi:hypothetical protein
VPRAATDCLNGQAGESKRTCRNGCWGGWSGTGGWSCWWSGCWPAPCSSGSAGAASRLRAWRHRRQSPHGAGPGLAERAGLVRPSPISLRSGVRRRQHPLEPGRRPAARRADPARKAVHHRRRCRAHGGRGRAAAALPRAADRHCADRPAADQPGGVRRGASSPSTSPARPTACSCRPGSIITAGSWRC